MSFINRWATQRNILYLIWFIAVLGTLVSLYFSEVLFYWPCVLCWYQRVALYPLTVIIPIALLKKDYKVYMYIFALNVIGTLVSIYHNLIYYDIIQGTLGTCISGVSCTTKYVELFGFVSIPLLALAGFMAINILLIVYSKRKQV